MGSKIYFIIAVIVILVVIGVLFEAFPAKLRLVELGSNANTALQELRIPLRDLPSKAKPLDLILLPAGSFVMGSPESDAERHVGLEWPAHEVQLTRPFCLAKYEVTQAQWTSVMGSDPVKVYGVGDDYPVYFVNWFDCAAFCNRLSELTGRQVFYSEETWEPDWKANGFRLPTDAEREYATRAGTSTSYSFGDIAAYAADGTLDPRVDARLWCNDNIDRSTAQEVGQKLPNPWGFFDIHGNLQEWCADPWEPPSVRGPMVDPYSSGRRGYRTIRDGAWFLSARYSRAAYRYRYNEYNVSHIIGFRVAATWGGE